ncbi:MAG: hypothetical protein ACFFG0_17785 [Candidatus Thorarchaeota archaeon]
MQRSPNDDLSKPVNRECHAVPPTPVVLPVQNMQGQMGVNINFMFPVVNPESFCAKHPLLVNQMMIEQSDFLASLALDDVEEESVNIDDTDSDDGDEN